MTVKVNKKKFYKRKIIIVAFTATIGVLISGCAGGGASDAAESRSYAAEIAEDIDTAAISDADMDTGYDEENSTLIKSESDEITVSGNGVTDKNNKITIGDEGTYIFTGTFDNEEICVKADDEDYIRIVLDNASLVSEKGNPAISVIDAEKVCITLAAESQNTIIFEGKETDATVSGNSTGNDEADSGSIGSIGKMNAAISSCQDLTFNGDGTLNIQTLNGYSVRCSRDVIIIGGEYNITGGKDAIVSDGVVRIFNSDCSMDQ